MNREETAKILGVISSAYNKQVDDLKVAVWQSLFQNDHVDDVYAATLYLIENGNTGFMPTVPEIKSAMKKLFRHYSGIDKNAIISEIERASRNSYYHSIEEYNALSEMAKKVVASPSMLREYGMMKYSSMIEDVRKGVNQLAEEMIQDTPKQVEAYMERRQGLETIRNKQISCEEGHY